MAEVEAHQLISVSRGLALVSVEIAVHAGSLHEDAPLDPEKLRTLAAGIEGYAEVMRMVATTLELP